MKKKSELTINIHITNRWLYTLIAFGVLVAMGIAVYAYTNPSTGIGHSYSDIEPCGTDQVLKMNSAGTAWICATDATGYSSLDDLKSAVSNDFHNLGGTDHGFGGMYIKKGTSCYLNNSYTLACTCPTSGVVYTVGATTTFNILGVSYTINYCTSNQESF